MILLIIPKIRTNNSKIVLTYSVAKIKFKGSQVVFWDLGGQLKMRSMWEKYYSEANSVIFVVDSVDLGRLDEAKLAYGNRSISISI
jgi:GTPase SAR1 family protein